MSDRINTVSMAHGLLFLSTSFCLFDYLSSDILILGHIFEVEYGMRILMQVTDTAISVNMICRLRQGRCSTICVYIYVYILVIKILMMYIH